jgi:hypothetical protein
MKQVLYIECAQGLGDHILANGIYRHFSEIYDYCIIPSYKPNQTTIERMLLDKPNIYTVSYPKFMSHEMMRQHGKALSRRGYEHINLREVASDYYDGSSARFDERFYKKANIPFDYRWSKFYFPRNQRKEEDLFDFLNCGKGQYIFLHEDTKRNFRISRDRIPNGISVVSPNPELRDFSFFDYGKIIENATEIHCIESSFAALIEGMDLKVPKYSHRYARPETKVDYMREFTYRSKWNVLL